MSRLEKEGLIYRQQLQHSKRFYGLYPTEKGEELFELYLNKINEIESFVYNYVNEKCTADEIENYKKVIDVITQATSLIVEKEISEK